MRIFLDVDGVLSPMPQEGTTLPAEWEPWDILTVPWRWSSLNLSPEMGWALAPFARDGQISWLTTWDGAANDIVGAHFLWPVLPVAQREPVAEPWGKFGAVVRHLDTKEPFIWVEDGLGDAEQSVRERLDASGIPYLLICPDPATGLTRAQLGEFTQFRHDLAT